MKQKGFTLIELLVVIAIIGILASVVLASLNSARAKGSDAAIKATLTNARSQAELYYSSNNATYTTVCASGPDNISAIVTGATNAGSAAVECADDTGAWALEAQLKTAGFFCVDSTGRATTTAASTIAEGSDYACE